MTKTDWEDQTTALREKIDRFPSPAHPAVRPLIRRHEALLAYGLEHEYIAPEGAARV